MATDRGAGYRVAFFGAMSLLAREVRNHLDEMAFPVRSMHLYDTGDHEGSMTEYAGEAMIVTHAEEELVTISDIAFVCGEDDPRSDLYLDWSTRGGGGVAFDLAGASRSRSDVPVVNCEVNAEVMRSAGRVFAAPHPMAQPLSTILHRIGAAFTLVEASGTILRPASDFDEAGIEELHHQAVGLLSFSEIPTEVFGRQIAFNVAPVSLQEIAGGALAERVRQDVLRVLAGRSLPLSVRILQAPIFHGHCYSIRAVLDGSPPRGAIEEALEIAGSISISRGGDGRTPAELATESGIWIGEIAPDRSRPGALWIWAVADAIRSGAALNAARMAEKVVEILA